VKLSSELEDSELLLELDVSLPSVELEELSELLELLDVSLASVEELELD